MVDSMDENLLQIREYRGAGYQPLIDFSTWRVAILRWEQAALPQNITFMERHTHTDEVFVLLQGQAQLLLGGSSQVVDRMLAQILQQGTLYNVKQGVWHTVLLSQDASILIVENSDTGKDNTEYCPLNAEFKQRIIALGGSVE